MSTEQNKAVVHRFMTEVLHQGGNLDILDEVLAPTSVNPAMGGADGTGFRAILTGMAAAGIGLHFSNIGLIADEDDVVARFTPGGHAPGSGRSGQKRTGRLYQRSERRAARPVPHPRGPGPRIAHGAARPAVGASIEPPRALAPPRAAEQPTPAERSAVDRRGDARSHSVGNDTSGPVPRLARSRRQGRPVSKPLDATQAPATRSPARNAT
jgi:hypothetical protein